jgi:hypothetical protein
MCSQKAAAVPMTLGLATADFAVLAAANASPLRVVHLLAVVNGKNRIAFTLASSG